jgi:cytidine deaminase
MLNEELIDTLVRSAMEATKNAYVPYSKVPIGACVMASDGTLYTGCTIENAVRNLSISAGEVAMYKAVADGKREFDAIAFIGNTERPFVPNGAICQLLAEFNVPEVVMSDMNGDAQVIPLTDLLPYGNEPIDNHII